MGRSNSSKAWFAALHKTRFFCLKCKALQPFKKYLQKGIIELSCGHQRHTSNANLKEWKEESVKDKLDGNWKSSNCIRGLHFNCMAYHCSCLCHVSK